MLLSFSNDYKLVVACGFQDETIDELEDDRITFSNPFTISGYPIAITSHYSPKMKDLEEKIIQSNENNVPTRTLVWHKAILIPNEISMDKINRLSDVPKLRGKILEAGYYK
jgi:hypothetical protein